MRLLKPTVAWRIDSREASANVDMRLLELLRVIGEQGSLAAAARATAIPYRTAWAMLDDVERDLGASVATLSRGRGATLTPLGRRWLAASQAAGAMLAGSIRDIEVPKSRKSTAEVPQPMLRVCASHDIALAQLRDRWRLAHAVALEFHGSAESLDLYRSGRAHVAGFHIAVGRQQEPLLATLEASRDCVLRFLTRAQGLIVPRGNPRRVRGIEDVVTKRLTIINRQPGSGTRLLFDRLLARAHIAPAALAGYSTEEFTHAAVAATVAAGRADVGFGIRAAAAQFGLGFVPIVTERYLFACAKATLASAPMVAFRALLASRATRAVVTPLPGYALDAPGTLLSLPDQSPRRRPKNGYRGSV